MPHLPLLAESSGNNYCAIITPTAGLENKRAALDAARRSALRTAQ